jgi:hypothetical protein
VPSFQDFMVGSFERESDDFFQDEVQGEVDEFFAVDYE